MARSQCPLRAGTSADVKELFHREGNAILPIVPGEAQQPARTLRNDADDELLERRRDLPGGEVEAREILVGVIVGAPLTCLAIDDQLGSGRSWQRPEGVLTGWDHGSPEYQILVGCKHRRCIRTSAPNLIPRNEVAEDHASAL